ncbi:hypothetical protein SAMN04489761_4321 [Tenacibaculum sp. MAR_2009_124]|uniref:hypothetical protein n=1 Tax=Tenacibaculum sp. MAR_2009_124 TaxID=1250059 RepID=UPI000895B938|nr:hypothetical protein [Tenacibaculum sp. MAR_2009_124]SED11524.1 hypothetical protein SAMN04489761_4321 [Tenacibaculum sp. MAR_2009_124]
MKKKLKIKIHKCNYCIKELNKAGFSYNGWNQFDNTVSVSVNGNILRYKDAIEAYNSLIGGIIPESS